MGALEATLRRLLYEAVTRGAVTLSLKLARSAGVLGGGDEQRLQAALDQIARLQVMADAQGIILAPPTAAEILTLKGATEAGEGAAGLPDPDRLLAEAGALIGAFNKMRRAEGAAVGVVLLAQIDKLAALTEAAAQAAQARGASHAARMRAALAALLDQTDLDEARLLQEMAILALKTDVTEEIDRLRAHVGAARDLLAKGGAVGRKLDFLMQEFNREANTLCSKAQDGALTALGLDLKLVIDQTREQVQNVE